MALDADRLKNAIKDLVDTYLQPDPSGQTLKFCQAMAEAIVSEVTTHAVVNPTLLVAPGGGGPVTGTGTIS